MDRDKAWKLLCEYTKSDSLRKHAIAVEASMVAFARKFGEDEQKWGLTGLLHDFDYEQFPDEHPKKGESILKEQGCSEEIRRAILAHYADFTGVQPESLMEKTLCAVDELSGFIVAVALVRPGKKLADVQLKSVKKKMKDKSFARGVDREYIKKAVAGLGVDLDQHIQEVIDALQPIAEELGLA